VVTAVSAATQLEVSKPFHPGILPGGQYKNLMETIRSFYLLLLRPIWAGSITSSFATRIGVFLFCLPLNKSTYALLFPYPKFLRPPRSLVSGIFLPKRPLDKYHNGLVKALLPVRVIFSIAPVGGGLVAFALFAFASCEKNEPIDEAKAAGLTTVDFPLVILVS
jgi:hypothetical protein